MILNENKYIIYDRPVVKNAKYYFRLALMVSVELFFKLLFLKKKKFEPKKYHISICSCFKDEAPFIKEWIEYHLMIGVDHFYLYNNNSTDGYMDVLLEYIDKGIVTLTDFPQIPVQQAAYQHWYDNYRGETDWVSFLDLDEFFTPLKHDNLPEWLSENDRFPVLSIYWKMFGTSGAMEHDYNRLVTEQYTVSWQKLDGIGKLLINTNYAIEKITRVSMHNTHVMYKGFSIPPINTYGHFIFSDLNRTSKRVPNIQVNHYWSKAFKCYEQKHKKGSGAFAKSWKTFDKFLWHENHNISSDFSIYRFLIQLKLRMGINGNECRKEQTNS